MFAIIVVGHGEFSTGLINAAEMILGEQEDMVAVPLLQTDSPETYYEKLKNAVSSYDDFVVLADLKGGTPANLASMLVKEKNCTCITGTNLPILLEIIGSRFSECEIEEAITVSMEMGSNGILKIDNDIMSCK
jgi:mannose/fructose/sorbose-specific phosphotransferase system IIA component